MQVRSLTSSCAVSHLCKHTFSDTSHGFYQSSGPSKPYNHTAICWLITYIYSHALAICMHTYRTWFKVTQLVHYMQVNYERGGK